MVTPSITPIGTCRIHSPLRRGAARYPITLDLARNYGFVHTSDEALQLLRFLQGEKQFRPEAAPLVMRDGGLARYEAEQWQPSDLHVVEISSAKRILCGPDAVQSNYVQHHFPDFFADRDRSRAFWRLVGRAHRGDLVAFLEREPSYQLLAEDDRRLLTELSLEQQSFKAIKTDMAEIVDRLGADKVVFVTHVNATTPDGARIPTRERVIRWVRLAAEQLGASLFDPTPTMEDYGQDRALESGGLDLTHYTMHFSDRLYDAFHIAHVAPLVGIQGAGGEAGEGEQQAGILAAKYESLIDQGEFFAGARGVHEALLETPEAEPLIAVRGLIRARIGDFQTAVDDLSRRGDVSMLSQAQQIALLEALDHTGRHGEALEIAQNLLAEEVESASIYRAAAIAAEHTGRTAIAIAYAKQAFRLDRSDLTSALQALILLSGNDHALEAREWRREMLETIAGSSAGAFELGVWAIDHRDEDLHAAAVSSLATLNKAGTVDLAEDAFEAGMLQATAHAIPIMADLGRLARPLSERRNAIFAGALQESARRIEGGEAAIASRLAGAITRLADIPSSQIEGERLSRQAQRVVRSASLKVRELIRASHVAGDPAGVVAVAEVSREVLLGDPDTAVIAARAYDALDRRADALALMKAVQHENPASFSARRWAGRLAAMSGDYATALEMYSGLRSFGPRELAPIKAELDRFLHTVPLRSVKQLRELVAAERDEEAMLLGSAIERHLGPLDGAHRQLARLRRRVLLRLREMEAGETEMEDRAPILQMLVRIQPDDRSALRRLALELMRQSRFAEAAEYWEKLHTLDPDNESADRNRVRCATLAQRRTSAMETEVVSMG